MPFCCQHKALTIFRAKGRVLAAWHAQLCDAELQIVGMYTAKEQRPQGEQPRAAHSSGRRALLPPQFSITPPHSPTWNEVSI